MPNVFDKSDHFDDSFGHHDTLHDDASFNESFDDTVDADAMCDDALYDDMDELELPGVYQPGLLSRRRSGRRVMMLVLVGVGLIGLLFGMAMIRAAREARAEQAIADRFVGWVDHYLDTSDVTRKRGDNYVTGKMIVIDQSKKEVDAQVQSQLPDELRAQFPEEVGSVVLVERKMRYVGDYVDSATNRKTGKAFRGVAYVKVIDQDARQLIASLTLMGPRPSPTIRHNGDSRTRVSAARIVQAVSKLPRR